MKAIPASVIEGALATLETEEALIRTNLKTMEAKLAGAVAAKALLKKMLEKDCIEVPDKPEGGQ